IRSLHCARARRHLHSFPTRRSSDLKTLLDVLDPVQRVLAEGGDDLVARVRQCAFDSAAATAAMDATRGRASFLGGRALGSGSSRSEEHTSELQSRGHLVCRLLLEKK